MKYRVVKGHTWGIDRKPEGAIVELDESAAAMFVPWKLVPVEGAESVEEPSVVVEDAGEPEVPVAAPDGDLGEVSDNVAGDGWDEWLDLPDRIIDLLEEADVGPEELSYMTDAEIEEIDGIGPKSREEIRGFYPYKGE